MEAAQAGFQPFLPEEISLHLKEDRILVHPTYFPNVALLGLILRCGDRLVLEACDNYQKQTLRNRCQISTDQGVLNLNIPIRHLGQQLGRQKYREVRMEEDSGWRNLHWKSLQNAFRSSPYFEFYEDEIRAVYDSEPGNDRLFDFNLRTLDFLCSCWDLPVPSRFTESYETDPRTGDARFLVEAKGSKIQNLPEYTQVFGDRNGFLSNMSGLDLLCNLGPEATGYLAMLPSYSPFF